jgi:hypothetical protein
MLHPFGEPTHLMLLIATGLLLGQQRRDIAGAALGCFLLGFIVASLSLALGAKILPSETPLLAIALLCGALTAAAFRIGPWLALPCAIMAGVALGLASPPDAGRTGGAMLASALDATGLTLGMMVPVLLLAGLTVDRQQQWLRVGIRIAGAWIVAIAVMSLALQIAEPTKARKDVQSSYIQTETAWC